MAASESIPHVSISIFLKTQSLLSLLYSLALLFFLLILVRTIHRLSPSHPLSRIPGPRLPRTTSLWLIYQSYSGHEATAIHRLHREYGPTVLISPNAVDISDGEALYPIYVEKGGFRKPTFYNNFSVDGFKTIFSEDDPHSRAPRARSVLPAFSMASMRERRHFVTKYARELADIIGIASEAGKGRRAGEHKEVDVLGLARSFAADSISEYLFGRPYGALAKNRAALGSDGMVRDEGNGSGNGNHRADGCVDLFDVVGRYWYLHPRMFNVLEWFRVRIFGSTALFATFDRLDAFGDEAVEAAVLEKQDLAMTYQGRLLEAGFSEARIRAETKDALLAGIETTGMNLGMITWYLAKHPNIYDALRQEIAQANDPSDDEVQGLPYVRAVINEGLRIGMANPTRFARVVPPEGWRYNDTFFFPPGVEVSCSPSELHFNAAVYDRPDEFLPERWLKASKEMYRDLIPFGVGARKCIAMNLALMEMRCAVFELGKSGVLAGAKCCKEKVDIREWFSIKVVGDRIDLRWD